MAVHDGHVLAAGDTHLYWATMGGSFKALDVTTVTPGAMVSLAALGTYKGQVVGLAMGYRNKITTGGHFVFRNDGMGITWTDVKKAVSATKVHLANVTMTGGGPGPGGGHGRWALQVCRRRADLVCLLGGRRRHEDQRRGLRKAGWRPGHGAGHRDDVTPVHRRWRVFQQAEQAAALRRRTPGRGGLQRRRQGLPGPALSPSGTSVILESTW